MKYSLLRHCRSLAALGSAALLLGGTLMAARAQDPPKKDDGGQSRGTEQMKGGNGVFGTVYTLNDGINFQLLSARYTLEPLNDYNGIMPNPDEKLLVLTYAIKNSGTEDWDGGGYEFTAVDENENDYTLNSTRITANGGSSVYFRLKPGQGIGQDPTVNAILVGAAIPGKAKIKKIILKQGRKNVPGEDIIRFEVAGYAGGSPKNVIQPLPKYVADPTDPSGAVTLETATVVPGKAYPDGYFSVRFDGLTYSTTETVGGEKPEEGKRYAIATFTVKNIYKEKMSTYELTPQLEEMMLKDTDGEKYQPVPDSGLRKAKRDDSFGSTDAGVGEEYTYRVFFAVPKDVKLKTLLFGKNTYGHRYAIDLTQTAP